MQVDHTRLDDRDTILHIHFEDARHARQRKYDAAHFGDSATAETGACSPRHDWHFVSARKLDHLGDLLGGLGYDYDRGHCLIG